jgi:uncharacterized membrane protein
MRVPLACAFWLGVAGGARTMLPAAAVSRAVRAGTLCMEDTPVAFLEGMNLNRLLVGLALAEIVADKLPMTTSRKATAAFTARVLIGALAGTAVGVVARRTTLGALLGVAGAVVGTEGGAARLRSPSPRSGLTADLSRRGVPVVGVVDGRERF